MTRAELVTYLGDRFGRYLEAVGRTATDDSANLKPAIDDALLAMGYSRGELATAEPPPADEEGYIAQARYHLLKQIVRDLGGDNFNVTLDGNSFMLEQIWKHAREDLADARASVLALFGTVTSGHRGNGVATLDLNFLDDVDVELG